MHHQELEELADSRNEELREVLPTLDELEACDLRELIYGKLTQVISQVRNGLRYHADGTPFSAEEMRSWKHRALDAQAHLNVALRLVKTHLHKLSTQQKSRSGEITQGVDGVKLVGTMGLFQALYEVAKSRLPDGEYTDHELMVMRAARDILDNATRKKVGA